MDSINKVAEWTSSVATHAWETHDIDLSADHIVTKFEEGMT